MIAPLCKVSNLSDSAAHCLQLGFPWSNTMTREFIAAIKSAGFVMLFLSSALDPFARMAMATKPTVLTSDCIRRAEFVAVVRVKSLAELAKTRRGDDGKWLPARYNLNVDVVESLKGKLAKSVEFECDSLVL